MILIYPNGLVCTVFFPPRWRNYRVILWIWRRYGWGVARQFIIEDFMQSPQFEKVLAVVNFASRNV